MLISFVNIHRECVLFIVGRPVTDGKLSYHIRDCLDAVIFVGTDDHSSSKLGERSAPECV